MIKDKLKKLKALAVDFFHFWPELLTGPIALGLFVLYVPVALALQPEAGIIDIGAFHLILFGIVKAMTASFCAWLLIRLQFGKEVFTYLAKGFEADFKDLNNQQCEKLKLALLLLGIYFFAFVLAM